MSAVWKPLISSPAGQPPVDGRVRGRICESVRPTGEETTLVDGGILSNFPIEVFDRTDGKDPRRPTLGVKVTLRLPAGNAPRRVVEVAA